MNFLLAKVEEINGDGFSSKVLGEGRQAVRAHASAVAARQPITLGIRAQHLRLARPDEDGVEVELSFSGTDHDLPA